jgi:hypothetical protein
MPAMKPIFLSQRPILPPGTAFGPETAVLRLETAPPFGAGAALDAPGAEFRRPGAALAVAGASLAEPGVAFRRPGASLALAGAALRQPGGAPIFRTEAPAAGSGAPIARSGHPATHGVGGFQGSAETPLRINGSAGRSARAPLDLAQPGTVNREPRTA